MFRRNEDHVVCNAVDIYIRQVQRLRIDETVHRVREKLAERRGIHVGGSQNRLFEILPRAPDVVLRGRYIDLRLGHRRKDHCSHPRPCDPYGKTSGARCRVNPHGRAQCSITRFSAVSHSMLRLYGAKNSNNPPFRNALQAG